ncbi:MAG: M13 family metallopeptidase, partial [Pseudomonadota bacterium]
LDLIARAETHNDVASLLGSYNLDAGGLLKVSLRLDPIEGAGYVASIEAADLLLGSQALYLRSDSLAVDQKALAQQLLIRLLKRSTRLSRAEDRVAAVLDLEHRLANLYPDPVTARRPVSPEHVFDIVGLETQFPEFPWRRFLAARGVTQDVELQLPIHDQVGDLISLFNTIPVQVWQDYMSLRLILSYGNYLDDTTDRLVARFDAASIGVEYQASRRRERAWRVAVDLLPDPVGQAYVDEYLDDQTVADVHRIVDWTIVAFRERIQTAEWLTDQTRSRALEKLNAITVVVGRPPGWNNFEFFTPIRGSLFANAYSRQQLRHRSALARLVSSTGDAEEEGTGSDNRLKDIFFSPLSVGAYYLPTLNTIIVPAAYLQAPYYDSSASAAVNFGALGTTIGHELGHAFDDQGARRGPDGQIADWWEDADQAQFTTKGERLSRHLSTYDAAPGIALNTGLTLGENLSDLVGVEIAYRAFELERTAATGAPITQVDAQSFFISYAQKRRAKRLTTAAIDLALSNTHSPPEVRVNGILPHIDSWYGAFDIDDTNALWLSPEERVRVW